MDRLPLQLVALIALASISGAAPAYAQSTPPEPTFDGRKLVALLGDSITEGVITDYAIPASAPPADKLCWQHRCFADIVRTALDSLNIDSVNRGFGGATSRDWDPNDRLEVDVHFIYSPSGDGLLKSLPASNVVVIYLGTNDAVAFFENAPPTSPDDYEAHIEDLIRTLRRRGVDSFVLVTAPIPVGWKGSPPGDLMYSYASRARNIARRHRRVRLADVADRFPDEGWQGAAIHPNILGHGIIAEIVLEEVLQSMRPRHWPGAVRRD